MPARSCLCAPTMVRSAATRHRTLVRWDGPSAPPAAQLNMNAPMMLHATTARHTAAPLHAHQPRSSPCAPSFPLMACALYPTVIDTQPETARREHPAYSDVLSPGQQHHPTPTHDLTPAGAKSCRTCLQTPRAPTEKWRASSMRTCSI